MAKQQMTNAMVTNHLRAPYGVYFTKKSYDSTAPVRRPAGGRKNRTIFYHVFRHRTVLKILRRPYGVW